MSQYRTHPDEQAASWNTPEEPEEPMRFACACGELDCWGWDDDRQNIRIGSSWWAADCRNKPLAILEDQDRALRADEARDDR